MPANFAEQMLEVFRLFESHSDPGKRRMWVIIGWFLHLIEFDSSKLR
jgi:hypothetical protein